MPQINSSKPTKDSVVTDSKSEVDISFAASQTTKTTKIKTMMSYDEKGVEHQFSDRKLLQVQD